MGVRVVPRLTLAVVTVLLCVASPYTAVLVLALAFGEQST